MKERKERIVEIDWVDSYHDSDWVSRHYARKNHGVSKCKTTGYLLKSNFREVTVFQSKADNGHITDMMSIPRKAILKMRFVED